MDVISFINKFNEIHNNKLKIIKINNPLNTKTIIEVVCSK
jgi:hypothetical protein